MSARPPQERAQGLVSGFCPADDPRPHPPITIGRNLPRIEVTTRTIRLYEGKGGLSCPERRGVRRAAFGRRGTVARLKLILARPRTSLQALRDSPVPANFYDADPAQISGRRPALLGPRGGRGRGSAAKARRPSNGTLRELKRILRSQLSSRPLERVGGSID